MASPARVFSADQAGELLDHLAAQVRRTIKRPDERHVHDLRVAIRRFSQALSILSPCLVRKSVKELRQPLRQIMTFAGEVRNSDITQKLLMKMEQRVPAQIAGMRRKSQKALVASLRSWVDQDAESQWRTQLQPCRDLSATAARKLIRQSVERAAARLHVRARDIEKSMRALHRLRIAAKKLRYTLELAGAPTDRVKDLQTRLGDINDYCSARRLLKQIDGTAGLRRALAEEQRKKVRRFRREFKEPQPAR